jgi:hypothetical protein
VLLLAKTDSIHGNLSGPTTKKIMEREFLVYRKAEYQRLANISVSHLYRIRRNKLYERFNRTWTKTMSTMVPIGERRKPTPNEQPGFLRVDTVHQGDQGSVKGVYHINAVDCITQYECVASCEKISEAFLLPVIEEMLLSFPFVIHGFHSDNGSEFINKSTAKLLDKLLVEQQTKSRSRHCNDNALVESKNASVVRKHLGYAHIPQRYATLVNKFCHEHLNPYTNYHRPCYFALTKTDSRGKERKTYPYELIATPFEKFKSLPDAETYLKEGITMADLEAKAMEMSDTEAAEKMQAASQIMFGKIFAPFDGQNRYKSMNTAKAPLR